MNKKNPLDELLWHLKNPVNYMVYPKIKSAYDTLVDNIKRGVADPENPLDGIDKAFTKIRKPNIKKSDWFGDLNKEIKSVCEYKRKHYAQKQLQTSKSPVPKENQPGASKENNGKHVSQLPISFGAKRQSGEQLLEKSRELLKEVCDVIACEATPGSNTDDAEGIYLLAVSIKTKIHNIENQCLDISKQIDSLRGTFGVRREVMYGGIASMPLWKNVLGDILMMKSDTNYPESNERIQRKIKAQVAIHENVPHVTPNTRGPMPETHTETDFKERSSFTGQKNNTTEKHEEKAYTLQKDVDDLKSKLKGETEVNKKLRDDVDSIREQNRQLLKEFKKLQKELQSEHRDAQTIKILQRKNDEMEKTVEETEKTSKETEEEHIKWVEAMEKMRTDISKYEKALTKNLQKEEKYKKRLKEEERKTKDAEEAKLEALTRDARTITILQRENDEMKRKVEETEKTSKQREEEHIKWIEAMDKMTTDIAKYEKALTKSLQKEEEYKKRLKEEERKTKDAEEAKLQALTRLSKEMGTKLNDNNPAIADLSDPNRATELAEMYSEIYDNEWTDALEELDNYGYTEERCIRTLLDIVKKADAFCKEKAENQMRAIEDSFFMSNTDQDKGSCQNKKTIMKMLKDHRKSTAEKNAEKIYKEFSNRYEPKYKMETEYAKKIVKLCWLMAVQDPPVCLGREAKCYDKLDTDIFRPFTQTGTMVSYIVWLPMFLHKGGPLLAKGVAQPVSFRAKSAPTSRTNGHRNDKTEVNSRQTPERYTAGKNHIPQTKHDWESLGETRRNQNYEMDFKHQITTTEDVVKSYAPQPKVARKPTDGYYKCTHFL